MNNLQWTSCSIHERKEDEKTEAAAITNRLSICDGFYNLVGHVVQSSRRLFKSKCKRQDHRLILIKHHPLLLWHDTRSTRKTKNNHLSLRLSLAIDLYWDEWDTSMRFGLITMTTISAMNVNGAKNHYLCSRAACYRRPSCKSSTHLIVTHWNEFQWLNDDWML